MRNVTITLDEEVARWVRVRAAERDTSVSRYLGELLEVQMAQERAYAQAMTSFLRRRAQPLKAQGGYARREELHARTVLR